MEKKNALAYEQLYTERERGLADHIIGLEKAALDKWFNGDTSGYRELWSKKSFSYFDGANPHRVDDHNTISAFLETIERKLYADHYDFCCRGYNLETTLRCLHFRYMPRQH